MRQNRKFMLLSLILMVVLALTAVVPMSYSTPAPAHAQGSEIPAAFADPANPPRVALVRQIGDGAFMARYLAGAQSMADELGIELLESNARGDDAQMVTMVETAIEQQVDAIIIDHGRTDTLQPVIEQALAAGIKVVTFDLVIDNPNVPEIEQDDMLIGFELAKKVVLDTAASANVIYVNVAGFAPLDKRDRSWQDFLWRYPSLHQVAQIGAVTNSTAADTQTRMEATLTQHPDAGIVVAMWDEFAKGSVRAIMQAGKAEDVKVYSVDVNDEDIQLMIEDGSPWEATVATDSYNVGRLGVRAAVALVAGESVDKYLLVEPALITRDFLLGNSIENMDQLVAALPVLGESELVWLPWMSELLARNGYEAPAFAAAATEGAGGAMAMDLAQYADAELPQRIADGAPIRVALVRQIGDGAFMARYLAGAQSMADELGIELLESNARGDDAQMVTMVETAIEQQVDAIIIDHGRTDTLQPVIEQALAAGIKVVTFDLVIDNPNVPEIEQDDMLIGFELAKKVVLDTAASANVIYVNVAGFAPLDKRDRSWQDFLWRYPSLHQVAQIGAVTNSTAADTQTRMEATLTQHPDAGIVVAMWDEFAKGSVRAIMQAGKAEDVKVYSVDVNDEDIQLMIEDGSPWEATVATDSYNVGRLGVRAAVALVAGESVDKYLLVEPALITRDFLLGNSIENMDQLVAALPVLGESELVWFPWMYRLAYEYQQ